MTGVLDGTRVLDFGRYIAGPYCAALLSDLGAEVIRIEKVRGSEDRYIAPIVPEGPDGTGGEGGMFMQMNRNKLGLTLNPMKAGGREIVRRLVATADVVVANLPPQTRQAMGLDYPSLSAIKSDIILTTVSAYGSGGPYSHKVGFDGIGQAMSGAMYLSGPPEAPVKSWMPFVDFGTASLSAFATMAALLEREKTGKGQEIEGSLLGTALTFASPTLIEQAVIQADRVASDNRGQTAAPADSFQTSDGWILVQSIGQPLFERWAHLMGENHWLSDPRFKDDLARGEHSTIISERMSAWCESRTTEQALAELEEARLPAGPVYTPQQALDDPHIRQTGFMTELDYPGMPRPAPVATTPVKLSRTPGTVRHRAPTLGEHTDQILTELGYNAQEIAEFRAQRVV